MSEFDSHPGQPSNADLNIAWTNAVMCAGIPGARADTRQRLQQLRAQRTTWIGDEIRLMHAIDGYLKGE